MRHSVKFSKFEGRKWEGRNLRTRSPGWPDNYRLWIAASRTPRTTRGSQTSSEHMAGKDGGGCGGDCGVGGDGDGEVKISYFEVEWLPGTAVFSLVTPVSTCSYSLHWTSALPPCWSPHLLLPLLLLLLLLLLLHVPGRGKGEVRRQSWAPAVSLPTSGQTYHQYCQEKT